MSSTHEIVILGGHYAGISTAHYLLRHVMPALSKLTPKTSYHLSIVVPHKEFYFNVAGPRHLMDGKLIPARDIYFPIADAFKEYNSKQFSIIQGKATALDPETKTVTIEDNKPLKYSTLVIATGTTSNSVLWQINSSGEDTKAEYEKYFAALPAAKTILISGGGAVGVETAGEVGTVYPRATTTLLSGTSRLLPRLTAKNSAAAETRVKRMGIQTVHNVRSTSSTKNAEGTTTVKLSDGSSRTVDVFIDATGGTPNTSFLPPSWLDANGTVAVDDKTLRCTGPGTSGVYAVGDVGSHSDRGLIGLQASIAPVGTSIGIDIAAKAGARFPIAQKVYNPLKDSQLVPTGPKGGVGQVMGWKLPSFLVWLVKSRDFFVSRAPGFVTGASYIKP